MLRDVRVPFEHGKADFHSQLGLMCDTHMSLALVTSWPLVQMLWGVVSPAQQLSACDLERGFHFHFISILTVWGDGHSASVIS